MQYSRSTRTNLLTKNSFVGRSYFIHSFGKCKNYPTVLDKNATQTVVSSHVVTMIRTIAVASINLMTKNWHRN